jgi:hypothetical protein
MPPPKLAKALARILGLVLLVLGLFSFLPNPLVGENGYFAANLIHAALFGTAGLILLAFSLKGESIAAAGLYFTGILFLALGVLGYRELDPHPYGNVNIFGVILYSHSDMWLDFALTGILFVSGKLNTSSRQIIRD